MRFFPRLVFCIAAAGLSGLVPAATGSGQSVPAAPRFVEGDVVSTNEGHATLRWALPEHADTEAAGVVFELEQSRDPGFADSRLRHRGPQRAFFVSGLPDGPSYFRVRAVAAAAAAGPWSDVLVVEVDYPGRGQVALLLVVGSLVFAGTVTAIVVGWQRVGGRRPAESEKHA